LSWRVGRLTLQREAQGFSFPGGLRDVDARNTAAATRPGALTDEEIIPFWGATARWNVSAELRLDGFVQFEHQKSVGAGCGTFFATNDYTPDGCNRVFFLKTITERENVVGGTFIPRAADATPANRPDQFGLSSSYLLRPLGTRVGLSFAHYHSRSGYTSSIKGAKLGPAPGFGYEVEYPGNKNMLSFTTATRVPSLGISWLNEISVTNGQPIQLNPSSLLAAFLRGQGPLAADAVALPANSLYHGYDRFRVIQAQAGVLKEFGSLLGAAKSTSAPKSGSSMWSVCPTRPCVPTAGLRPTTCAPRMPNAQPKTASSPPMPGATACVLAWSSPTSAEQELPCARPSRSLKM
jgi:hypothetical protein